VRRSRVVGSGLAGVLAVAGVVGAGVYATARLSADGGESVQAAALPRVEPRVTSSRAPALPPPTQPTPAATGSPTAAAAKATATPTRSVRPRSRITPTSTPRPKPMLARGSTGRLVRELQARLTQIGWFEADPSGVFGRVTQAAVAGFQRKRGLADTGAVDRTTWRRLVAMTHEPSPAELYARPVPKARSGAGTTSISLDSRCRVGRVLCIDKSSRRLRWVVDGQVVSSMSVRFGSQFTPTREGTFSVYLKSRDHVSRLYDTAMPYAMFFSGGQAVHYSADFAANGYSGASHGCVNVRDRGAVRTLFDTVRIGDKVVVYRA
jgi:peptidoglycan hydrolase-like protein with peptidoglycan-binding domain